MNNNFLNPSNDMGEFFATHWQNINFGICICFPLLFIIRVFSANIQFHYFKHFFFFSSIKYLINAINL